MITEHQVHFKTGQRSKKLASGNAKPSVVGRVPRIAKMMALAIRLDHLLKTGQVTDQAELARVGYVSRARLTQIMDLNLLAPDIQEKILEGNLPDLLEKDLRPIATRFCWQMQRELLQKSLKLRF